MGCCRVRRAYLQSGESQLYSGNAMDSFQDRRIQTFALCRQSEAAKQQLSSQLLQPDAAVRCALKWREDCTRIALHRAAIWMPSPLHFGSKRRRLDEGLAMDGQIAEPSLPKAILNLDVLMPG